MEWKRVVIDRVSILTQKENATLVKMPNRSLMYHDFVFWVPTKLLKESMGSITFAFPEDFKFKLRKYGYQDHYGKRNLICEETIDGQTLYKDYTNLNLAIS